MKRVFAAKLLGSLFTTTVLSACGTHQLFAGTVECDGTESDVIIYYNPAKEEGFVGIGANDTFVQLEMDDVEDDNGELNFVAGAAEFETKNDSSGLDGDVLLGGQTCKFTSDPAEGSYTLYDIDLDCNGSRTKSIMFLDASRKEGHFSLDLGDSGVFFFTMDDLSTDNGKLEFKTVINGNDQQTTFELETESGDNGSFEGTFSINGTECDVELTPDK